MHNKIRIFALFTTALAFTVILLGAYTRLKDAGLGCPDWPGCYGKLIAAQNDTKAWIEMIHRYLAGSLGLCILLLAICRFKPITALLVILVAWQALLGMWTVTLKLYPIVVMGHLLGGFALLATLWWFYLQSSQPSAISIQLLTLYCWCALIILILQIALGGWVSANYAAVVCADFPSCQGSYWPPMDIRTAFDLTNAGIMASPGTPLENTARVTIQMFHRLGALVTLLVFAFLSYKLIKNNYRLGWWLLSLLTLQIILGITNVLAGLPLAVSLMHNACAALLLLTTITILYKTYTLSHLDLGEAPRSERPECINNT